MKIEFEELQKLKNEFIRIKRLGYVPSTRNGPTGIGKTLEDLLGKKEDTKGLPDYHGIELKTKRGYTRAYVTLFNATPEGEAPNEIKRLRNTYGYYNSTESKSNRHKYLQNSVQANCSTLIGNRFLFKLYLNYDEKKIYLNISDPNFNLIESKAYWPFETLKIKLNCKLKYMALIKAWPKKVDGKEYYKYYDIEFFKLKTFEEFLKLIEDGTIRINFKVGIYTTGPKKGTMKDHGTSFEIQELDMEKLFVKINV